MSDRTATAAAATAEIGTSQRGWNLRGMSSDDRSTGLRPDRWYATLREMVDDDATVGTVMFATEMMIRTVAWHVEAADDTPEADEWKTFVEQCMDDLDGTWPDMIADILSMIPYAYSLFEVVYKRRLGDTNDPTTRSMYDDGKIGWRKWSYRPPETKARWVYDNGDVSGWEQRLPDGRLVTIPRDRFLLFTATARYGQPEGQSVLRRAYVPWYHKKELQVAEAIGVYRDLAGLLKLTMPGDVLASDQAADMDIVKTFKEYTRNTHRGTQEGIIIASDVWEGTAVPQYGAELLSSGGARQFDTNAIIMRYRTDIALTMLADFVLLGHETTGTYTAGVSKAKIFLKALSAWLDAIAEEISVYAIRRLVKLNGGSVKLAPKLAHDDPEQADLGVVGQFVKALHDAGILQVSDELTKFIYELAGWPEPAEIDVEPESVVPPSVPEITPGGVTPFPAVAPGDVAA